MMYVVRGPHIKTEIKADNEIDLYIRLFFSIFTITEIDIYLMEGNRCVGLAKYRWCTDGTHQDIQLISERDEAKGLFDRLIQARNQMAGLETKRRAS